MHARFRPIRTLIITALDTSPDPKLIKRVRRMEQCCVAPLYALKSDGRIGIIPGFCRDRMCPTCQNSRGREVGARVLTAVVSMNAPRMLTVTLKHKGEGLVDMLDRLYRCFRALRQTDAWAEHVIGGIATLEVTYNDQTDEWHAHLHALIDGVYWAHASIKAEWLRITKDSSIVDIRPVHDRAEKARYVSSYIAKPADVIGWRPETLCEYALALAGRRLVVTFGTLYRSLVDAEDCETKPTLVEPLASVPCVVRACGRGCVYGLEARKLLMRSGGIVARSIGHTFQRGTAAPEPLTPAEVSTLIIALRRVAGDRDAWLPELEPERRFEGRSHAGKARPVACLPLFTGG